MNIILKKQLKKALKNYFGKFYNRYLYKDWINFINNDEECRHVINYYNALNKEFK